MLHTKLLQPPHEGQAASPLFNDALSVRIAVFVHEQHIPLELEVDADDSRSWHWIVYDDKAPVATARLVPPPHASHHQQEGTPSKPQYDLREEPCVRIGRVAVRKEYRGRGLAVDLLWTILDWVKQHPHCVEEAYTRTLKEEGEEIPEKGGRWNGLVRVHSQVQVQRVYARVGFETEEKLGRWIEDGIEHVGMVLRMELLQN
ncbi:acyl-CoA N-acyltransferase [Aspergillus floccosus]